MKSRFSLTEAVRDTLYQSPKQWFTVAECRDRLQASGFDFSGYASNPLASISTTLARLVPKDAEKRQFDAVTVYRAKNTKSAMLAWKQAKRVERVKAFFPGLPDSVAAEIAGPDKAERK
jgi:hypothetical protein